MRLMEASGYGTLANSCLAQRRRVSRLAAGKRKKVSVGKAAPPFHVLPVYDRLSSIIDVRLSSVNPLRGTVSNSFTIPEFTPPSFPLSIAPKDIWNGKEKIKVFLKSVLSVCRPTAYLYCIYLIYTV